MRLVTKEPQQTKVVGQLIGSMLEKGDVILLCGPLGSGKTVLVKGIARSLGIEEEGVTSPTFTLVNEYKGRIPLYHLDLYRLDSQRQVVEIGITEYLHSELGVTVVEWAEKVPIGLIDDALEVEMHYLDDHARAITLRCTGPRSCKLLHDLQPALRRFAEMQPSNNKSGDSEP